MNTTIRILALIALLGLVVGCKPSHRVTFKPALISIDPGEGWKLVETPATPPTCTPALVGQAGLINAVMLEGEVADAKQMADKVQAMFVANSKAVPDSFKQENFTTDSGLNGVHLSYSAKGAKGGASDTRSHSFITRNGSRRYISISYITSPDAESAAVLEAIRKTLQVE